ncbi:class C sortase [uncultured Dysosmobacter sp.]|uniref:class C sortase n=1 Tax=uncultured Dysosmobacter sp. TaxID=2591384 RepID=UPI00261AAF68|nr:class C sortase [uncultured Dysosmobacter sp.]
MEAVRERIEEDEKPCVSSEKREKRDKRVGIIAYLLFGISILVSLYLLAYTPIHNWFHSIRMAEIIADYDQKAAELSDEELSAIREAALAYNSRLELGTHFQPTQKELDEYSAQLDFTGTGMMGYIQIPKLKVKLPIYHTTSEEVMEEAVGHIPGSSLPVGGVTCHTVLCAHRDLPTAYLFHDLDKLEMGDTFTLTVLDETVTYAVDQVTVVRPQDVEDLAIEPGQDYCTLVTCHPHGSSEFRMLVRGKRVA